jgi:hypothetical protein
MLPVMMQQLFDFGPGMTPGAHLRLHPRSLVAETVCSTQGN